jgi:hypothetical protein
MTMNPEDDGTDEMTAVEMASEEYIGAMQNVCDAVEEWQRAQVEEIDLEPVEAAGQVIADAMFVYEQRRDELRAASEAEVAALGI